MTVRSILRMGDPRLLATAAPVADFATPALRALVDDLFETMRATDGVGLAAPQIGVGLQVVVFGCAANPRYPQAPAIADTVLINPVIEALDDAETLAWEGCLSLPGLRGEVPRWQRIRYRGFDEEGRAREREVEDFHARVVQHECDHLWGRLYPMRMRDLSRFGFIEELQAPADPDNRP